MALIRDKKWCYEKAKNNYPLQRFKSCPEKTINHQDATLFAVGSVKTDNKLWYSDNGINWSNQNITGVQETMNKINDMASYFKSLNNYIYVAVGDPSTNNILYSYNKKDWNFVDISYQDLSSEIFSITYAVNKFVAVSESKLLYSYDGLKWFDSSDNDLSLNKVYYGDKFIAINTNPLNDISSELLYSDDGINWEYNKLDTFHFKKINNIKFYNDKWYIVGITFGTLHRPIILESDDGISGWNEIDTNNFFDDECKNIVFKKTEDKVSFNDPCKPDIINKEKQWIAIGNYYISTNKILKSDDIINWTDVSNDFSYNTIDLISMNNFNYFNYIIIGRDNSNNSTVKYSLDGINWNSVDVVMPNDIQKLIDASWKYTEIIPEKIICQPKAIFTTPPAGSIATTRSRFSHVATNSIRGNARYSGRYTKAGESNTIYGVSTRPINRF